MPLTRGRAIAVGVTLVGAGLMAKCGTYTAHLHEFSPAEIEVAPGLSLSVTASGRWSENRDGSVTSGPLYSIAVRDRGAGVAIALSDVRFVDESRGSEVRADHWQPAVLDDAGEILLLDRSGVFLSQSSKTVLGILRVRVGEAVREYPFSGLLEYSYREEKRNSFLAALNSV